MNTILHRKARPEGQTRSGETSKAPDCWRGSHVKALIFFVGLKMLLCELQATNRFFRDLEATSPNGRFRVEAKSPENVTGPWQRPFQSWFVYRLFEKGNTNALWSRQQLMEPRGTLTREGPPVALYVNDDGWVAIRTADALGASCELLAVSPAGEDKLRVDILKTLVPGEDGSKFFDYVQISSAGYQWGQACCRPYFVTLHGATHFCLSLWWGQRLLIDLSAGRTVAVTPEFEPELLKVEKAFVLSTLEAARLWEYDLDRKINPGLAKGSPGPSVQEVIAALLMTANLKIDEAVPFVRKLESSPIVLTTSGGSSPYEPPLGGIQPATFQNLTVRQAAQLCLRRLGLRPSTHQTTRLYRNKTYWQPGDPLPFQREDRVQQLKLGMKPEEVMELMGAPDFITHRGWEYDLDGDSPATLVIRWGAGGVEGSENEAPPKWRNGVGRDRALVL